MRMTTLLRPFEKGCTISIAKVFAMTFPIAIASYAFHGLLDEGKCDVFTYLNLLVHRYGVRYADIWTGFLPTLEPTFLKKIREEMDRRDVVLANLCVDGHHLWWYTS